MATTPAAVQRRYQRIWQRRQDTATRVDERQRQGSRALRLPCCGRAWISIGCHRPQPHQVTQRSRVYHACPLTVCVCVSRMRLCGWLVTASAARVCACRDRSSRQVTVCACSMQRCQSLRASVAARACHCLHACRACAHTSVRATGRAAFCECMRAWSSCESSPESVRAWVCACVSACKSPSSCVSMRRRTCAWACERVRACRFERCRASSVAAPCHATGPCLLNLSACGGKRRSSGYVCVCVCVRMSCVPQLRVNFIMTLCPIIGAREKH